MPIANFSNEAFNIPEPQVPEAFAPPTHLEEGVADRNPALREPSLSQMAVNSSVLEQSIQFMPGVADQVGLYVLNSLCQPRADEAKNTPPQKRNTNALPVTGSHVKALGTFGFPVGGRTGSGRRFRKGI